MYAFAESILFTGIAETLASLNRNHFFVARLRQSLAINSTAWILTRFTVVLRCFELTLCNAHDHNCRGGYRRPPNRKHSFLCAAMRSDTLRSQWLCSVSVTLAIVPRSINEWVTQKPSRWSMRMAVRMFDDNSPKNLCSHLRGGDDTEIDSLRRSIWVCGLRF